MKHLFFIIILLSTQLVFAQSTAEGFEQAYKAQEALKHEEAIQLYQGLLEEGVQSAEVEFNLAMAYYGKQDLGRAILHLERAQRLAPSDKEISTNLELIYNEQQDGLLPLPVFFLKAWTNKAAAILGPNTWGILAIVLCLLSCLAVASILLNKAPQWHKSFYVLTPIVFCLALMSIFLAYNRKNVLNNSTEAIITATSTSLYSAPDQEAKLEKVVHAGLKVSVIDDFEGWMKIKMLDGQQAWVEKISVERI